MYLERRAHDDEHVWLPRDVRALNAPDVVPKRMSFVVQNYGRTQLAHFQGTGGPGNTCGG